MEYSYTNHRKSTNNINLHFKACLLILYFSWPSTSVVLTLVFHWPLIGKKYRLHKLKGRISSCNIYSFPNANIYSIYLNNHHKKLVGLYPLERRGLKDNQENREGERRSWQMSQNQTLFWGRVHVCTPAVHFLLCNLASTTLIIYYQ